MQLLWFDHLSATDPLVVGTHLATQQIVTGQRVEVDGLQGIVRLP